jgi:hypothetical protein
VQYNIKTYNSPIDMAMAGQSFIQKAGISSVKNIIKI